MKVKELENYIASKFKKKFSVCEIKETRAIESITGPKLKQISIL